MRKHTKIYNELIENVNPDYCNNAFYLALIKDKLPTYFLLQKEIKKHEKSKHIDIEELQRLIKLQNIIYQQLVASSKELYYDEDEESTVNPVSDIFEGLGV